MTTLSDPSFSLDELNPSQRDAVTSTEGPLLILAGAGSGKTRVITHRIAYLLEEKKVPPYAILAVTFTNKAAGEMKERVVSLAGKRGKQVWISTFHSACVRILRQYVEKMNVSRHFTITDASDSLKLIKDVLKEMNVDENPHHISYFISKAKNSLVGPDSISELEEFNRDYKLAKKVQAYQMYEERLRSSNAFDFDDLLFFTWRLFEEFPEVRENFEDLLHYILVDEYQDTNHAQYQIIRQLSTRRRNLCVVGDDDQSIYRWRGADITNILSFEQDYPSAKVVTLSENYRSTGHILKAAACLIGNNQGRKDKELVAVRPDGLKVTAYSSFDERDEGDFISANILNLMRQDGYSSKDFAVFYRTNAQSRSLEHSLRGHNIHYAIVGGVRFYDRMEIRDLIAYMRLILNPPDWISFERIINSPARGIGKVSLDRIRSSADGQTGPEEAVIRTLEAGSVNRKAASSLQTFLTTIADLREKAELLDLDEFVVSVLEDTGYLPALQSENTDEARSRVENLQEFLNEVDEFLESGISEESVHGIEKLSAFLDQISLVSDIDSWADKGSTVTLMTLHTAKGLEFPVVFLAGMEEEFLPHIRSLEEGDREELEEERRLCYVGMTRSRERLFLTMARKRRIYGDFRHRFPSRFLSELPSENVEMHQDTAFPIPGLTRKEGIQPSVNGATIPISEFHYEPEHVEGEESLPPGTQVRHPMFGTGQVMAVEGTGGDARITVYFPKGGKKRLIAKYANLQVV